ncbi:MAG TPA: Asp-tRNA(Asn)/Glu-tRNA(Gln) amidotransferase subunit GatC [Armatimonadota bacterium]|nr:Asp-tRNA(Asn)/Glu-tRNA(Gln) amidotransferase subunit GatC [Armatimonadota bacterium]
MRLSRDEIAHVALLSRLKLTEEEMAQFTGQLNAILDHFAALTEADTGDIDATTHVVPMTNVMRADVQRPSFAPDDALANAPERAGDQFKVPRVVE